MPQGALDTASGPHVGSREENQDSGQFALHPALGAELRGTTPGDPPPLRTHTVRTHALAGGETPGRGRQSRPDPPLLNQNPPSVPAAILRHGPRNNPRDKGSVVTTSPCQGRAHTLTAVATALSRRRPRPAPRGPGTGPTASREPPAESSQQPSRADDCDPLYSRGN